MKILIKAFFRQRFALMKNSALVFVVIILGALMVWPYLDSVTAYLSGFSDYYGLIISLGLLLLLFRKNPMISIDEASMHYLEGTKILRLIYIFKYACSFVVCAVGSSVITYVITSPFDALLFVQLTLLMNLCNVLNWKSYHESIPMSLCLIWYALLVIPFVMSLDKLCIVASLISLVTLIFIKRNVHIEKYKKLMKLCNKNMLAFALHDQVMMASIANEFAKEKHFSFKLKDEMLSYPLVAKSVVIDTLRQPPYYWGMKIILFVIAVICSNEISITWLSVALIPVLFGNIIASFIRDSAYEANKLVLKQSSGLVIPYSDWYIALSYSAAPAVLCTITLVGACVFCKLSVFACLLAVMINLIINVLWHKLVVSHAKRRKLVDSIGYSLCVAGLVVLV